MIATLEIDLTEASAEEILSFIRSVDDTATADLIGAEAGLGDLRDWATRRVIAPEGGSTIKGVFHKAGSVIREPLADSLEDYMGAQYKTEYFEWETVLDKKTGRLDRSLDGKTFKYDSPSSPIPPLHPNCRCRRVGINKIV